MNRVGAFVEVNLSHLRDNFRLIQSYVKKEGGKLVQIMPILKANAYGHGLLPCAEALWEEGATLFGVALVSEAIWLTEFFQKEQQRKNAVEKKQIPGKKQSFETPEIVVLIPPFPEELPEICSQGIQCVVTDIEIAKQLNQIAEKQKKQVKVHLFIDTGMRREGIEPENALAFLESCKSFSSLQFVGLATHFATADEENSEFLFYQLQRFQTVLNQVNQAGYYFPFVHAANSAALFRLPESHFSLVRPGLALYGYGQNQGEPNRLLKPILSLKTRIVSLRPVSKQNSVGYGRRYYTSQNTNIATLPIGYGDGLSRHLSGKMDCLIQGNRYPLVGTICMDQCMVDLGNQQIQIGEEVVLIGTQGQKSIWADELAEKGETISYEILAALSSRLPRFYKDK